MPPVSDTTSDVVSTVFCSAGERLKVIVLVELLVLILLLVLLFIVSAIFRMSALFSNKWIIKLFSSVYGSNAIDLPTKGFPLTTASKAFVSLNFVRVLGIFISS